MKKVLQLFFRAEGTRPVFLLACLLLASLCQAVGIGTLLPALSTLTGSAGSSSPLNQTIREAIAGMGIEPSIGNLILIVVGALVLRSLIAFAALAYTALEVTNLATRLRVAIFDGIFAARWR